MNLYLIFKYVSVLFDVVPLFVTEYPARATPICSMLHHLLLSAITQLTLSLHTPCLPPCSPHFLPSDLGQRAFANDVCQFCPGDLNRFCRTDIAVGVKAHRLCCRGSVKPVCEVWIKANKLEVICKCYLKRVCLPCLVCLTLWAAAVCLTVAGYEDVGQASGSGDFCKGAYGTAVAAAASAQNKQASSVTGPGVGECRHMPQ